MAQIQLKAAIVCAVFGLALSQFHQSQFGAQPAQQYNQQQQYQQQQQTVSQFAQQQQRSSQCPDGNGTYPVSGQCDAYLECKNGVAEEKLCPDGLLFNEKLGPHHFPCQYPIDVSCDQRAKLQSPQATDECPHQFGYFKMGDRVNCGQFMNCVNGRGFMFDCPEGLAFSQETYRCEWPDQVNDCDAEAFVGFTCPQEPITDAVTHFNFYRHAGDCQVYYVCIEGRPRMYRCSEGKLFDDSINQCNAAENVTTCGSASGFRATAPKPVAIQRQVPTLAPVVVQQQNQFRQQQQPTQKPYQFNQFAAVAPTVAAPRTQFNDFNSFQKQQQSAPVQQQHTFQQQQRQVVVPQQAVVVQQQQQQFAPRTAFNSFTQAPAPVQVTEDPYSFVQPRIGSGLEAPVVEAQQQQQQFVQQTVRTTQPESVRPETRSQINNNAGQFNFKSTGRGSKRYTQ